MISARLKPNPPYFYPDLNHSQVIPLLCAGLLVGCHAPGPKAPPETGVALPSDWGHHTTSDPLEPWQSWIGDGDCLQWIRQALSGNPDLKYALAVTRISEARLKRQSGQRFPVVDASLSALRTQSLFISPFGTGTFKTDQFDFALSTRWEVDLWGRLRDLTQAAQSDALADYASLRGAELSVAANTAKAWHAAALAQQLQALAEATEASREATLRWVEENHARGLSGTLDLRLARANAASARAETRIRQEEAIQSRILLARLAGQYPSDPGALDDATLPGTPAPLAAGLPSELARRRPDVQRAELAVHASEDRARAARKDRWPKLSLTASGGRRSQDIEDLLNPSNAIWNLAANLAQPVFQAGALKASEEEAWARLAVAESEYQRVALQAFQEVEQALAREESLRDQLQDMETAMQESREAERLAGEQYPAGLLSILDLQEAERRSLQASANLLRSRHELIRNRIDLLLALGGPFRPSSPSLP